jgi:hypothetical protein
LLNIGPWLLKPLLASEAPAKNFDEFELTFVLIDQDVQRVAGLVGRRPSQGRAAD